mmetsp:Transcript_6429/g.18977  ORF Transcript_6429/g.18977 Transcript_6429/m.18977 type:complete len:209 (+) Transcript_6429:410-1036(+)
MFVLFSSARRRRCETSVTCTSGKYPHQENVMSVIVCEFINISHQPRQHENLYAKPYLQRDDSCASVSEFLTKPNMQSRDSAIGWWPHIFAAGRLKRNVQRPAEQIDRPAPRNGSRGVVGRRHLQPALTKKFARFSIMPPYDVRDTRNCFHQRFLVHILLAHILQMQSGHAVRVGNFCDALFWTQQPLGIQLSFVCLDVLLFLFSPFPL